MYKLFITVNIKPFQNKIKDLYRRTLLFFPSDSFRIPSFQQSDANFQPSKFRYRTTVKVIPITRATKKSTLQHGA